MKGIIRKIVLVIFMCAFAFKAFAPTSPDLTILSSDPVNPFIRLINAIGIVETGYDTLAYNPLEEATGFFQIRPIRLYDYNKRTGSKYTMNDLYNYYISEKIFLYYASLFQPHDFEMIAKSWNGSGSMTIDYWNKVKAHL